MHLHRCLRSSSGASPPITLAYTRHYVPNAARGMLIFGASVQSPKACTGRVRSLSGRCRCSRPGDLPADFDYEAGKIEETVFLGPKADMPSKPIPMLEATL